MTTVEPTAISVIVPVMNEEETIPELASEISQALMSMPHPWECLWVNDGSTDGTGSILQKLCDEQPEHRHISLKKNRGQSVALGIGFSEAKGEVIVTLDGDGQNDPADIPMLVKTLEEGDVDMVNGIRQKRRDTWVRRLSSRLANGFRNWLTNENVSDVGCAIRAVRTQCVVSIPVFKGMHRFLPTLVRMQGYKITECPVRHRPRLGGRTKYGINNRLWVGLADSLAIRWMQCRMVFLKGKCAPEYQAGQEEAP